MLRKRYRRIRNFFARVILNLVIWEMILPRIGFGRFSRRNRSDRLRGIAIHFRDLAVDMGGVMIKVGQFLSTRVDVLPQEITGVLANLQDEVQPESFEDIRQVAESDLGSPLMECYRTFDPEAMAAASLGQVHMAQLHSPEEGIQDVVVKVQRPNIEEIITTDITALRTVGRWIQRYRPIAKRANIPALLGEFARITYQEIDYLTEGKNAETFAVNFELREGVRVPKVIWPLTTKRVLTLENVQAIKITDYNAITAAGIKREDVAQRLFESYLKQIFEDGFFHADPHPGNLFVEPLVKDPDEPDIDGEWRLNFVDFGMVGRMPTKIRAGLRELAMGVGTKDSVRIIQGYQMLGVLLPEADLDLLQKLETKAFDQFWGKSMSELKQVSWDEMHEFAKEFREILFDMPFQIPEDMIFLGRCVAILAGMCTGLSPDFNVWEGMTPFAQKILREETSKGWDTWREELVYLGRTLISFPRRIDTMLEKMEQGELAVETPNLNKHAARLERTGRRLIFSLIFGVLFISGIQLYLADETGFSIALMVLSILPLWRVIFLHR